MFYFAHFTTLQQRNKNNACILISSFLLVLESTSKAAVVDEKSLTDGRTTASTHLEHVTLNSGKLLNGGSFSTFSNFGNAHSYFAYTWATYMYHIVAYSKS